jgi:hypothetical protein
MINKKYFVHTILLSIPLSLLVNSYFFSFNFKNFVISYGGIFVTIPFFYWFYYKYYGKSDIKGLIVIQLEILLHFFYTMALLFYDEYSIVYNFLIFLIVYYCFKLAILIGLKK